MSRATTKDPVSTVEEIEQSVGDTDVQTDVRAVGMVAGISETSGSSTPVKQYPGLIPWRKGQSGNPLGRGIDVWHDTKWYETLKKDLPERFAGLRELTKCKDPRVALQATTYLIDRVLGRPTERVEDARPPLRTVWIGPYGAGIEEQPALPRGEDSNDPSGGHALLEDESTS